MDVETFQAQASTWIKTAEHPRWKRRYTDLTHQPTLEATHYLRANGRRTYLVAGGGQDFVRVYSQRVYGIPPEQVVGLGHGVKYVYNANGKPVHIQEPKLLLDDDKAGKPEGVHLEIGARPVAAFGNAIGDRETLEYVTAGPGARLGLLVLHDDPKRE
jgi:hypothetical protein